MIDEPKFRKKIHDLLSSATTTGWTLKREKSGAGYTLEFLCYMNILYFRLQENAFQILVAEPVSNDKTVIWNDDDYNDDKRYSLFSKKESEEIQKLILSKYRSVRVEIDRQEKYDAIELLEKMMSAIIEHK